MNSGDNDLLNFELVQENIGDKLLSCLGMGLCVFISSFAYSSFPSVISNRAFSVYRLLHTVTAR